MINSDSAHAVLKASSWAHKFSAVTGFASRRFSVRKVYFPSKSSFPVPSYFSIEIPDDWTYETSSNSYATELIGFGVINTINLTPMKIYAKDGIFQQDAYYSVKNAPLEKYVDYKLDQMNRDLWNVTDMENIKWIRF